MEYYFQGDLSEVQEGLCYVAPMLGIEFCENGIPVSINKIASGLQIYTTSKGIEICYSSKSDFFRACAQMCGFLREGETVPVLSESRKFDTCGMMLDCSRNAVLRVETVKDLLRKMACMGLNTAMLYTEDTYKLEEYPYFGYMRGAYSKEELREMDRYASALGIELIPCIQTLGHLKMILHWPQMADLRDTYNTLLVDEEKTYDLITAMFRTLRECFSTKKIHIGMDEAPDIGLGSYLKKHGYEEPYGILSRHLSRVVKLAKEYGFEPMMWSDLFFRLGSKTKAYYDLEADIPDDISEKIPQGISLVYWDYYHEQQDIYRAMIQEHQKMGYEIIFASGIWKWSGMGVKYDKTFRAAVPALQVCREIGIRHVFATLWGDDGAEVDVYSTLLGMQLFAEYSYHDSVSMERLKRQFQLCLGFEMEAFIALQVDDVSSEGEYHTASKQILYQDPMMGLFDKNLQNHGLKEFYKIKLDTLSHICPPEELVALFDYQQQLLKVLHLKCDLGNEINEAYHARDTFRLQQCCKSLEELYTAVLFLEEKFSILWEKHNKEFGLERIQLRLGGVMQRARSARRRLQDFLDGQVDRIEELEVPKLYYGTASEAAANRLTEIQFYDLIASASSTAVQ